MSAQVLFKGNPLKLSGDPPAVGSQAPAFSAVAQDLSVKQLSQYAGKTLIVTSVPSLDTGICDMETRRFNAEAGKLGDSVTVLTISRDLPFAQKRWCGAAGVSHVITLSDFREHSFGKAWGVELTEGPVAGLLARAVWVVDKSGQVRYQELVKEVTTEPNYEAALAAVKAAV